jgi:hypothetical protein
MVLNQSPFGGAKDIPCAIWDDKDLLNLCSDGYINDSLLSAQRMLTLENEHKKAIFAMSL